MEYYTKLYQNIIGDYEPVFWICLQLKLYMPRFMEIFTFDETQYSVLSKLYTRKNAELLKINSKKDKVY